MGFTQHSMAHTRIRRHRPGYSGPTEVCLFVRVEKKEDNYSMICVLLCVLLPCFKLNHYDEPLRIKATTIAQ